MSIKEARIRDLKKELERLKAMPEDPFDDGTVLRFDLQYDPGGPVYAYAAIRADGSWWFTGSRGTPVRPWEGLLDFLLGNANLIGGLWFAQTWERVEDVEEYLAKYQPTNNEEDTIE